MARPRIQLKDGQWNLWRLADDEFVTLGHHALPMLQNFDLLTQLGSLRLGQALTVLERSYGPSSPLYDHYRGSFSFPLLLTFEREQRISYLLRCHDYRGVLHFPLYRVEKGEPSIEERSRCHTPLATNCLPPETDEFITDFYNDLMAQAVRLDSDLVTPFFRAIQSDIILYGHDGSQFFEKTYENWTKFEQARADCEARLGPRRPRSGSDRVESLIDRVTAM